MREALYIEVGCRDGLLGLYVRRFAEFLATPQGRRSQERVRARRGLFRERLAEERLGNLSPQDLIDLFTSLEGLGPAEGRRLAEALVETYGMDNIRETLKFLIYADQTVERRFEEALVRFGDMPLEALMEFLTYAAPEDFCIWDEHAKRAMKMLGQSGLHGLTPRAFSGPIGPLEYVQAVVALNYVREVLNAYLQRRTDYLDVHLFCLYTTGALPSPAGEERPQGLPPPQARKDH